MDEQDELDRGGSSGRGIGGGFFVVWRLWHCPACLVARTIPTYAIAPCIAASRRACLIGPFLSALRGVWAFGRHHMLAKSSYQLRTTTPPEEQSSLPSSRSARETSSLLFALDWTQDGMELISRVLIASSVARR